ncbi:MAG: AAA family ATPase, partial [Promethearchaeota archaeon]
MSIEWIKLKDITTYRRQKIVFTDGVNALIGDNGTGKTTVLKMIGYSCYACDLKPSKSAFISNLTKAKSGSVTACIVGADGRKYIIERQIKDSGGSFKIRDYNTRNLLPNLQRKSDVIQWLKGIFQLDPSYDLDDIFKNAVGVNQGTFTAPFSLGKAEREKIFNPIINVECYKEIYEKLRHVVNLFKNEYNDLEKRRMKLEGRVSNYENTREKVKKLKETIESQKVTRKRIGNLLKQKENKYSALKDIKEKMDGINSQLKEKRAEKNGIESQIELLKKNLQRAEDAQAICERARDNHDKYEKLNAERDEKDKLYKKMLEKSKEVQKQQAKVDEYRWKIDQIESQIQDYTKELVQLPKLEEKHEEYETVLKKVEECKFALERIKIDKVSLKKKQAEKNACDVEIEKLSKKEKIAKDLEIEIEKLDELQAAVEALKENRTRLEEQIKELENNKNASVGGICPFLKEKCKNIGEGSLEDYFQEQIDDLKIKLLEIEEELKVKSDEYGALKEKKDRLNNLKIELTKLSDLKKQVKKIEEEILELKKNISKEDATRDDLDRYMAHFHELEPFINQLNQIRAKEKELPDLKQKLESIKNAMNELIRKINDLKESIKEMKTIEERLNAIKVEMDDIEEDYKAYESNIQTAKNYDDIKAQIQVMDKHAREILKVIKSLEVEFKALQQRFDRELFIKL